MTDQARHLRIEPSPKRIRGFHGGRLVVDSAEVRLVWEIPYFPWWYFPLADVRAELRENGTVLRSPQRGPGTRYDLVLEDGSVIADAAWRHVDSPVEALRDLLRIDFDAVESWFEEDVEVAIHPRAPDVRVDALRSSRHVRVLVDGEVIADSTRPVLLFETGLPTRYYLPKTDVRMDLLVPTDSATGCPYKGFARYWNVVAGDAVHEDLAWSYPTPLPEAQPVAGYVCFYNERVDLEVDGVALDRPTTKFS